MVSPPFHSQAPLDTPEQDSPTRPVRDNYESKKDELAKKISDVVGAEWTVDINPNQIYAYAKDGYAKESPGAMIAAYANTTLLFHILYIQSWQDAED